jgi:hypothetical protein
VIQDAPDPQRWFYAKDNQPFGPLTLGELRELADTQFLAPSQLVWTEGMPDWVPAGTLPVLFPPAPTPTPDAPGAPVRIEYYTPAFDPVYAGFWLRFAAIILDGLVIIVPMVAIMSLEELMDVPRVRDLALITRLSAYGAAWLYFSLMESSAYQATLGKRQLHRAEAGASRPDRQHAGRAQAQMTPI